MSSQSINDEVVISLPELFHSIWRLRWAVLILGVLGGIAGALFLAGRQPEYETKASMLVNTRTAGGSYQNGTNVPGQEDIRLAQDLAKTVELLSESSRVLERVLERTDCEEVSLKKLKSSISVNAEENTAFLWLTLNWEEPEEAELLLNGLMEVLPEVMLEVMDIGSVNVIDTAAQAEPVSVRAPWSVGIGAGLGVILGCMVGVIFYIFMPKIQSDSSLERLGLDVLGEIPFVHRKDKNATVYLGEDELPGVYREAYGRLAAVFRYLTEREKKHIFAFTSSISGEGKTTIVYNLAVRLTEMGCRVLLLDFDFKKRAICRLTDGGQTKEGTVSGVLEDGGNLERLVSRTDTGVYMIRGFCERDIFQAEGRVFPEIRKLKDKFDYILIDTPPVGILSDVQQMWGLIDAALLVVRQDGASIQEVEASIRFLKKAGIALCGSVLNGKECFRKENYKGYMAE